MDTSDHKPSDTMFAAWLAETGEQTVRQVQLMTAVMQDDPKHWWRKKLALLIQGAAGLLQQQPY